MRTDSVILPSSAVVELRSVSIADENRLAQTNKRHKKGAPNGLVEVLNRCTLRVVDPGVYPFLLAEGRPDWDKMLRGDFWWALLELRALSYKEGDTFDMWFTCRQRQCANRWEEKVQIRKDLPMIPLSEDARERVRSGQPFETTIDDRKVFFNLATGGTEDLIERMTVQHPGREMSINLRSQIVSVEGVEKRDILDWLDGESPKGNWPGLGSDDAEELRAAFDAAECGVDTTIRTECPKCGAEAAAELPFDRLLLPGTAARKAKGRTKDDPDSEANAEEDSSLG
ncbi:MAG: hypothetical protein M0R37_15030 [Bacteroidales bacterium]|jgi:hypothetical protein|nr:hypothetical protein [Bacteroidales bacterium]